MASRPLVSVQSVSKDAKKQQVTLPYVLTSPIRSDVVNFVHTQINKNKRQAYAVTKTAGMQYSAESWGTGRAVARVPRVSGGGTSRSGQGAFANMCRGGRMFSPTKVWRRWHRQVNKNQRRYAVCSALAASALTPLVMARGHRVEQVAEIPLVVNQTAFDGIVKTKKAVELLKALHAFEDVQKVKDSHNIRRGKGKMRNRRYVQRRGPLVVYKNEGSIVKAFRNIPGIELANVSRLNLLQLAPGGHLGRFIIWTQDAFESLDSVFGSRKHVSTQKKGYQPPRSILTNPDISRIANSDEVQSALRDKIVERRLPRKKNPLTNFGVMVRLNPQALVARRRAILAAQKKAAAKPVAGGVNKKARKLRRRQRSRFYNQVLLKEEVDERARKAAETKKNKAE